MGDVLKLAVGIPAYNGLVNSAHARMWTEFGNVVGASNERFRLTMFGIADVNPVDRARNQLVAKAMLHSSDWLFMIDADTWVEHFNDEDAGFQILRMISDAHRADAAIVSAAVVLRSTVAVDLKLAIYDQPGEDGKHTPLPCKWLLEQRRALGPAWAVGAACCALNLHKVAEAKAEYRFTDKLSEDLDYCRQIREKHGMQSIMVDPRVIAGHQSRSFPLFAAMGV